ncbi:MAG: SPFH domain-containing protein [Candidatus Riflebacteria bacterium]|nr:SPFH domain-containing protein [Candidatus Riflebacteria bacterium]
MAFGIGYFKGEPTEFILEHAGGRLVREGPGISFFYLSWRTSVTMVPMNTLDAGFIFNETTGNFQPVSIQGQLTYRIIDPKRMATILNFTIDPASRRYLSQDPDKLSQRLVNAVQVHARNQVLGQPLEEVLRTSEAIAVAVLKSVSTDSLTTSMGVEVLGIHITAIKPTPEMAKALEAEHREALQRKADEAIYARRAAAVEQERKIAQNELSTKITIEEQRRQLVDLEGSNSQKEADFEAAATQTRLKPYRDTDPRILLAMGFKELGERAGEIKQLTITPELISAIRDAR